MWRPEICDELKVTQVPTGLSNEVRLEFGSVDLLILVLYQPHPPNFLITGSFITVCIDTQISTSLMKIRLLPALLMFF